MYASSLLLVSLLAAAPRPIPPATPQLAVQIEPRLAIEAEAGLERYAQDLGEIDPRPLTVLVRRLGLERAGEPIRVQLLAESSAAAAEAPRWIAGWAYGALGTIVLLPERAPSYPDGSLDELLRHELTHVLVYRASAGREVPRWFHEGIALELSRPWGIDDRSRLTLALLLNERVPIASLDGRFAGGEGEVQRAYAISGALVRELVHSFGPGAIGAILQRVAVGLDFEQAFRRSTGVELEGFEAGFWRRYSLWYRWLPILTSGLTLWLLIALLTLWAGAVRSRRRAELEARWTAEEEDDLPVH
jgi:Peptidase MA superfamily